MNHFAFDPEDTIVAPATAAGVSALAVIRVSGKDAISVCNVLFKGKDLQKQASHTVHYGHLIFNGNEIDEVMVSLFKGPRSFTGEDSVEISCHGSMFIQRQIVEAFTLSGVRLAEPGEFSMRAYLNGRIDLAQAESVADVIAARNSSQLNLAMKQLRGGLSGHLNELRTKLLDFISLIELELDFGEEDVEFADRSQLKKQVKDILDYIVPLIDSFKYGNAIKNGIPVAIVGRPNAGKSSLLNALLNDDRAIVSDIAGTTRDTIEEEIHILGVSFRFIDTAGIRETEDSIEKIGIEKALKKIREADIVFYIFDSSELSLQDVLSDLKMIQEKNASATVVLLANKTDLVKDGSNRMEAFREEGVDVIRLSLRKDNSIGLEDLKSALLDYVHFKEHADSSAVVSNARHHQCLKEAAEALEQALALMESGASSDLLALEMKRGVQAIGDITGLISSDEVLGTIFGKFCIGK